MKSSTFSYIEVIFLLSPFVVDSNDADKEDHLSFLIVNFRMHRVWLKGGEDIKNYYIDPIHGLWVHFFAIVIS